MSAHVWPLSSLVLALLVPVVLGLGAALAKHDPLRWARRVATVAWTIAVLAAGTTVAQLVLQGTARVTATLPFVPPMRLDAVAAITLLLVSTLGVVIARYSVRYLDRDAGARRYARSLLATLAAVTLLVVSDGLAVMALAWLGTSIGLHQLLTHHRARPQALIAAHKKFIVSRIADALLVTAIVLVAVTVGDDTLTAIEAAVHDAERLPLGLEAAVVLFAIAACLKSAQIPFHGWLIQVMEAPTPVSALLHAGVVNLGGFLMIRLAPLLARSDAAELLLVVVGTSTAVIAALVMMTRSSVKEALAWSTCAQMGFMLAECGVGAPHLALLHLVAHSLYKAHAFLGAGSTVEAWRIVEMAPRRTPPPLAWLIVASAVAATSVALLVAALETALSRADAGFAVSPVAALVGLAVAPLVTQAFARREPLIAKTLLRAAGVVALYVALDHAFGASLFGSAAGEATMTWTVGWAVLLTGLAGLFAMQMVVRASPTGRMAHALHAVLFAGLHLDDVFTRLTFRIWPPRLPARDPAAKLAVGEAMEVSL